MNRREFTKATIGEDKRRINRLFGDIS